ncbi:D-aspartate oxidase [Phytophthora palmivora]|uniref:D-aspartate oxidase n=1 Tax=Phytophthora palmivora TaxID=4796 RepID=A0A2P4X0F9_9STRA|nr:D-aspartate oxidase [Phytophthora palmivora]
MKSTRDCRVVIVGGGVIGLTTALALLQSGFKHVKIVADKFEATTSHVAGGLWMPFALPNGVDTTRPRKWCEVTYAWLESLRQEKGKALGIHIVPGVEVSAVGAPEVVHPYWAHCAENFRLLSPEEAAEVSPGATHGFAFDALIYNPKPFMMWLHEEIRQLGGTFEQRRVKDLDDEDCDLLVNCSGLAAKELVGDDTVFPIRGQIVNVHNLKLNKLKVSIDKDGEHAYIIPRPNGDVVLGGTVQEHNWSTDNIDHDVDGVWERCCRLWPEVRNSKVIAKMAGLRPSRTGGVRLEMQPASTKRGALLIHNYAHGGSGHTLHWGCAQEVVELAKQRFPDEPSSKL